MNERTTLEKIAPTVEEAIARGLAELGLSREAVEVEVLDEGSRGLLGIGGRQARVRLMVKAMPSGPEPVRAGKPEESPAETPAQPVEGVEAAEDAFSLLDDNLLFISRQTVAELLEKMKFRRTSRSAMANRTRKVSARSMLIFAVMTWVC